jgi:hypothetical protein
LNSIEKPKTMTVNQIIEHLVSQAKPFKEIESFSDKPGIYALFFYGEKFPFEAYQPKPNEILYIGKTESSQQSRDADTHFGTGKTGSSTLRRTFGAFLQKQLKLAPIPRGQSDIEKKRFTHYKFDNSSEIKLTDWMQQNLGLSFYPYDKTPDQIDALETQLIHKIVPVLNIDRKNPENPYKAMISDMRKHTGLFAYKLTDSNKMPPKENVIPTKKTTIIKTNTFVYGETIHKYEDIWRQVSDKIISTIKVGQNQEISLGANAFRTVGNRKSYSFSLEFNNAQVSNNTDGSAVARDLARVLQTKHTFKEASKGKRVILKLDREFVLHIYIK